MAVFNRITEVKNTGGAVLQNRNQVTDWLKKQTFSGKLSLILSFSMRLKSGSILKRNSWTYFLTMISKNKLDMGPHLWVLDPLVIAHPAHPQPPKKQKALVKIITLICYLQTVSRVINRQAQQLTKCFNHFRQNQLTHRLLR